MTPSSKYDVKLKILTQPINGHLRQEQHCQISSQSDFKWQSLRLLLNNNKQKKNTNKMGSNMGSFPGPKLYKQTRITTIDMPFYTVSGVSEKTSPFLQRVSIACLFFLPLSHLAPSLPMFPLEHRALN